MPDRVLTHYDYADLARTLGCEPEALIAVGSVESRGAAFYADGFPVILFERHKFYKNARRDKRSEWYGLYPTICNPATTPKGGYGSMADQRRKFSQAFALDPDAAMMACSWGAFQELGENYDDYGFDNVGQFVDRMKSGIGGQLDIFTRSIRKRGLIDELQRHDWQGFARNYNGPNFRKFAYDSKMANEYAHWKAKKIDWVRVLAEGDAARPGLNQFHPIGPADTNVRVPSSTATDPAGSKTASVEPALPVELPPADAGVSQDAPAQLSADIENTNTEVPKGDPPDAEPQAEIVVEDWKPWVFRWLSRIWKGFGGVQVPNIGGFSLAAMGDLTHWYVYVIAAVVIFIGLLVLLGVPSAVLLAIWYFNRKEIGAAKMEAARSLVDPDRRNLKVRVEKK